jgi:hypothetical protein
MTTSAWGSGSKKMTLCGIQTSRFRAMTRPHLQCSCVTGRWTAFKSVKLQSPERRHEGPLNCVEKHGINAAVRNGAITKNREQFASSERFASSVYHHCQSPRARTTHCYKLLQRTEPGTRARPDQASTPNALAAKHTSKITDLSATTHANGNHSKHACTLR